MITFERYAETQLYLLSEVSPVGKGFFAFLLIPATTAKAAATPPATINIKESWEDSIGYYLFLKKEPDGSAMGAFALAVKTYFEAHIPAHTSFAWTSYDEVEHKVVGADILRVDEQEESQVFLAQDFIIRFRNYGLPFRENGPVKTVQGNDGGIESFVFEYPPFAGSPPPDVAHNLSLPLTGDGRGCFESEVVIGDFADDFRHGWDVGCRYFWTSNEQVVSQRYPVFALEEGRQVLFQMCWDPVDQMNEERTYLAFSGVSFLLVQDTQEEPAQFSIRALTRPDLFRSYFRTIYGEAVGLRPMTAREQPQRPARLVFAQKAASSSSLAAGESQDSFYLVPSGDFELLKMPLVQSSGQTRAVLADPSDNLLCGLSGTESLRFIAGQNGQSGDVLSFFPNKPAFAPVFPIFGPDSPSPGEASAKKLLTDEYTTAWLSLASNAESDVEGTLYFSQPPEAPLYARKNGAATTIEEPPPILVPFESPAALLPAPNPAHCFPMAPLAGAVLPEEISHSDPAFLATFENQILNPFRRETIRGFEGSSPARIRASNALAGSTMSTTPQGLLVEVDGFKWSRLLLAHNPVNQGGGPSLQFKNLNAILQAAFQTSELFLIITWDKNLKEDGTTFDYTIFIEGWPFKLDVSQSTVGSYKNTLIFKYCTGSIINRVKDTKSWTSPTDFNQSNYNDLSFLSQQLTNYIQNGIDRAASDEAYVHFREIVTTPEWNGILALNVTIGLEDFPQELRALLAGINLDKFTAHHFGVEANYADFKSGAPPDSLLESSLFGLIHYEDEEYGGQSSAALAAQRFPTRFRFARLIRGAASSVEAADDEASSADDSYAFKVLSLKVQFANSEIKKFNSTVRLTFNRLFGERVDGKIVDGQTIQDNNIILRGTYENHNGNKSYIFNLEKETEFILESKVVKSCRISKAQFNSIDPAEPLQSKESDPAASLLVRCNFLFWGMLSFHRLSAETEGAGEETVFDVFSFDYLSYSNLMLGMSFYMYDPPNTTFHLETEQMAFDLSASKARENSLFKNFPVQLKGITYGRDKKRPSDIGYAAILTPIEMGSVGETWYGLEYNLNLGSPGALAEKIGFTSGLLASWSPNPDALSAELGLKLPGSDAKGPLSIQGVIKLAADYYQFVTYGAQQTGYMLLFRNFGLSILGMKLPPNASTDVFLFGNPAPGAGPNTLGWFAAYKSIKKQAPEFAPLQSLDALALPAVKPKRVRASQPKAAQKKSPKLAASASVKSAKTKAGAATKRAGGKAARKSSGKLRAGKTGAGEKTSRE